MHLMDHGFRSRENRLGDRSRWAIETVDARFVGTQARLATSIRYVDIARNVAPNIFPPDLSSPPPLIANGPTPLSSSKNKNPSLPNKGQPRILTSFLTRAFFSCFRILPRKIRATAYDQLRKLGDRIYGVQDLTFFVRRLPFGLYLKYYGQADLVRNEFNALRRVRQETSIPVPEPFDVIPDGNTSSYLIMSRLPGVPLWRCQEVFSDRDYDAIVTQLQDYVAQLRDLPKTVNPEMAICNTLGEACREHRIRGGDAIGPFPDEAAFSQCVRFSDEPSCRGHKIVFTHADLNPRNILVDQVAVADGSIGWRVTGSWIGRRRDIIPSIGTTPRRYLSGSGGGPDY